MSENTPCPFCNYPPNTLLGENSSCIGFLDKYPVSLGHTLIVPRRHVVSFFDLTQDERGNMFALLDVIKTQLSTEYNPSGFNIGINDGLAAGQTIMHVHLHLIPRFKNDVEDPRGGIRWVIPSKARYWEDGR